MTTTEIGPLALKALEPQILTTNVRPFSSDIKTAVQGNSTNDIWPAGLFHLPELPYQGKKATARGTENLHAGRVCYNKAVPIAASLLDKIVVPPEPGLMGLLALPAGKGKIKRKLLAPDTYNLQETYFQGGSNRASPTCAGDEAVIAAAASGC